jgi:uncharacterized membrane protein YkvA (DUF1232 family)
MIESFITQLQLTYKLMLDGRVSLWVKAVPVFVIVYIVSPIDLLPFFPLDDFAILLGGLRLFEELVPDYIVNEYKAELGIDTTRER